MSGSDLFIGHLVQHHLSAHVHIQECSHVHAHSKSVQQLWPQLSLLQSGLHAVKVIANMSKLMCTWLWKQL